MGVENNPIEDRIVRAERLYSAFGNALLKDARIRKLLSKLDSAIKATREYMLEIGVVDVCRECALQGNVCCKKWVENEYDEVILLINRLMGVNLPKKRFKPDCCFFLSPNGCVLKAREVICVEFLCEKILKRIGNKEIQLRAIAGEELETLFILQEIVKKAIEGGGVGKHPESQEECNIQTAAGRKRIYDESM
jgi:hypothetical protein